MTNMMSSGNLKTHVRHVKSKSGSLKTEGHTKCHDFLIKMGTTKSINLLSARFSLSSNDI